MRDYICECGYVSKTPKEFCAHDEKCLMMKKQKERERIQEIMDVAGKEFHRCEDYKI